MVAYKFGFRKDGMLSNCKKVSLLIDRGSITSFCKKRPLSSLIIRFSQVDGAERSFLPSETRFNKRVSRGTDELFPSAHRYVTPSSSERLPHSRYVR